MNRCIRFPLLFNKWPQAQWCKRPQLISVFMGRDSGCELTWLCAWGFTRLKSRCWLAKELETLFHLSCCWWQLSEVVTWVPLSLPPYNMASTSSWPAEEPLTLQILLLFKRGTVFKSSLCDIKPTQDNLPFDELRVNPFGTLITFAKSLHLLIQPWDLSCQLM